MAAQETTTPQPKERIIFDADSYYGTEGENMAVEDIMERYGITEEEVREQYSDEEIFDRAMEMRDQFISIHYPFGKFTQLHSHLSFIKKRFTLSCSRHHIIIVLTYCCLKLKPEIICIVYFPRVNR